MKACLGLVVLGTCLALQSGSAFALTVRSVDILDGEVKNVDIGANAVTTDKIMDLAIGTSDLANLAVTNGKIAAGAVDDSKITGPISASKVSSAGLNADTVDGMHAADLAPAAHAHSQDDVTGLGANLAGKADLGHDHDVLYQRKYANVVVVAISGGDFADPIMAGDSITDASPSNRYLLKIMPGVYDLGSATLAMKEYVDIEGSGENATVITSSASGIADPPGTVAGSSNSEIRLLTIANTGSGPRVAGMANVYSSPKLANVLVTVSGGDMSWGIYNVRSSSVMSDSAVRVSGGSAECYGVFNTDLSSPVMNNVSISATGTVAMAGTWGIFNHLSSPIMTNLTVTASGLNSLCSAVENQGSSTVLSNSTLTASGTGPNRTIRNSSSATVLNNITAIARDGSTNYGMWNEGSGNEVLVDRSTFEGATYSIANSGFGNTMRVGSSKLVGDVIGGGTVVCVGSYNGNYVALGANCQ